MNQESKGVDSQRVMNGQPDANSMHPHFPTPGVNSIYIRGRSRIPILDLSSWDQTLRL